MNRHLRLTPTDEVAQLRSQLLEAHRLLWQAQPVKRTTRPDRWYAAVAALAEPQCPPSTVARIPTTVRQDGVVPVGSP